MFDLRSVFVANGIGIFLLLLLLYVSKARIIRNRLEDKIYSFMIIGVIIGCTMEAVSYLLDGKVFAGSVLLNYAANTYLYTANLLLPFFVLVYVDLGIYGDVTRIWNNYKPQIIVGAAMLMISVLNLFIPICFKISEQNVYERTPFSYAYLIIIFFYCLTALYVNIRYEKENGSKTFYNVRVFLLPIIIGVGLQFAFYGLSLGWLSSAIGLTGLYMMQQNEVAYIDSLVETYNRRYLDHILSAWISQKRRFAGAIIDIDKFKSINDSFGHFEGDRALKTTVSILKDARMGREWIFRFAGDEFIILKLTDFHDGLSLYMKRVNELLREYNKEDHPYEIALSYGMSYFGSDSGDINSFIKEMDSKMYEMKEIHHSGRHYKYDDDL